MSNSHANPLEMRWVPATDEQGRSYMRAVWVVLDDEVAAAHAA